LIDAGISRAMGNASLSKDGDVGSQGNTEGRAFTEEERQELRRRMKTCIRAYLRMSKGAAAGHVLPARSLQTVGQFSGYDQKRVKVYEQVMSRRTDILASWTQPSGAQLCGDGCVGRRLIKIKGKEADIGWFQIQVDETIEGGHVPGVRLRQGLFIGLTTTPPGQGSGIEVTEWGAGCGQEIRTRLSPYRSPELVTSACSWDSRSLKVGDRVGVLHWAGRGLYIFVNDQLKCTVAPGPPASQRAYPLVVVAGRVKTIRLRTGWAMRAPAKEFVRLAAGVAQPQHTFAPVRVASEEQADVPVASKSIEFVASTGHEESDELPRGLTLDTVFDSSPAARGLPTPPAFPADTPHAQRESAVRPDTPGPVRWCNACKAPAKQICEICGRRGSKATEMLLRDSTTGRGERRASDPGALAGPDRSVTPVRDLPGSARLEGSKRRATLQVPGANPAELEADGGLSPRTSVTSGSWMPSLLWNWGEETKPVQTFKSPDTVTRSPNPSERTMSRSPVPPRRGGSRRPSTQEVNEGVPGSCRRPLRPVGQPELAPAKKPVRPRQNRGCEGPLAWLYF